MTIIFASGFTHYTGNPSPTTFQKGPRARERVDDPIFGSVVDFGGGFFGDREAEVRCWCDENIGQHGRDFQMRNNRVSFARSGDADLCYLAFA